jgi:ubiquinone/menaquinone biosynthesis C-methylase UbiE
MAELDLLRALPKGGKRNVKARVTDKSDEIIRISKEYGELYFDGPREYGYGGYGYDGRWQPVARDIVDHFGLGPGSRILDVGCAKGFLVKDLLGACPGIEAFGLDISEYALMNCEPEVIGRLHQGTAESLPFPDGSFDAVICLNTLHNLPRERCITALREVERLAPGNGFITVDSYRTEEQRDLFVEWVLTAEFHDFTDGWISLFNEAGYTGEYNWTIIE